MILVEFILLVLAFALFLLAAFNAPVRYNLIAAGLACWVLVLILSSSVVSTR